MRTILAINMNRYCQNYNKNSSKNELKFFQTHHPGTRKKRNRHRKWWTSNLVSSSMPRNVSSQEKRFFDVIKKLQSEIVSEPHLCHVR